MPPVCRTFALLIALTLAACAVETARETVELRRADAPPRIALMPLDLTLSRRSAGGSLQPVAAWTLAAERNLTLALMAAARERGLQLLPVPHDLWSRPDLRQVHLLHRGIERAILAHRFGDGDTRLPAKAGPLGWSLGQGVAALRADVRADYALFVSLNDSYASTGRRALGIATLLLVGLPVSGGEQTGLATLVELQSGAVVWASRLDRPTGDLREPEPARETAEALLKDLPQ